MPGAVGTTGAVTVTAPDPCDFTQYVVGVSNSIGTASQNTNPLTTDQGGFMFEIRALNNIVLDEIKAYTTHWMGGATVYRYNRTYVTGSELGYKDYNNGNDPFDSTQWNIVTTVPVNPIQNTKEIALPFTAVSSSLLEICAGKTATFYVTATGGGTYPKMRTDAHPQNNAGQFNNNSDMLYGWGLYLRGNASGTPFLSGSSADAEANHMSIGYHTMV